MSVKAAEKSAQADEDIRKGRRQGADPLAFAERLREAKGELSNAELARRSGLSAQSLTEYLQGSKLPNAYNLLALADALEVETRWLLLGRGRRAAKGAPETADDGLVLLPHYDIHSFTDDAKPEPDMELPMPEEWMRSLGRHWSTFWLADMPDTIPNLAVVGDTIVCRDPDLPLQDGRTYIFRVDGRPIVRRVRVGAKGLTLRSPDPAEEPFVLSESNSDRIVPIARVLAAINLNPA